MKILLSEIDNIDENFFAKYDKIYFLNKFKDKHSSNNVEYIELYKYFMKSHKTSRELNKLILQDNTLNQSLIISLLKSTDRIIFESIRIIEILKDLQSSDNMIDVKTKYNDLIIIFIKILDIKLININFQKYSIKKNNRFITNIKSIFKIIILLYNSFFVKCSKKIDKIFFLYNASISYEFIKPYVDSNSKIFPFFTNKFVIKEYKFKNDSVLNKKFITFFELLSGCYRYYKNLKEIKKSNLSSEIKEIFASNLLNLEIDSAIFLSLKQKYKNLKAIIGLFDAYNGIDYVTYNLNKKQNIQTVCIPHGINFKYKVNYISYGTNIYTFWSKDHFNRLENSNLLELESTKKVITGNIIYKNTLEKIVKNRSESKNILIIGEYFSLDNYYSSPFNEKSTMKLFDTLENFVREVNKCNITIRTRLQDGYYRIAKRYVSDKIKISSPEKINLIDEINKHDLIIAVFSNALHEALILEKKVIQVNFLGIENYRDLAKDKLVYYATNESELLNLLKKWYNGELKELNYKFHLEKYCNNGKFEKLKIKDY